MKDQLIAAGENKGLTLNPQKCKYITLNVEEDLKICEQEIEKVQFYISGTLYL